MFSRIPVTIPQPQRLRIHTTALLVERCTSFLFIYALWGPGEEGSEGFSRDGERLAIRGRYFCPSGNTTRETAGLGSHETPFPRQKKPSRVLETWATFFPARNPTYPGESGFRQANTRVSREKGASVGVVQQMLGSFLKPSVSFKPSQVWGYLSSSPRIKMRSGSPRRGLSKFFLERDAGLCQRQKTGVPRPSRHRPPSAAV